MKKSRILTVQFSELINRFELPAFRGAIIEKTRRESLLFHNHLGENKYRNRYPLIQYKYFNRRPGLLCIDDGVDEANHFFKNRDWEITLSGRKILLSIDQLYLSHHTFEVLDHTKSYLIKNWLGLNTENFKKYKSIEDLSEKIQLLKSILLGNILSMAKGLDWYIEEPILLNITGINKEYSMTFKGMKVAAFDLRFKCNILLPNGIGLGKGASQGFGNIKNFRNNI